MNGNGFPVPVARYGASVLSLFVQTMKYVWNYEEYILENSF